MHKSRWFLILLFVFIGAGGRALFAQVSPEIQLGARGVMSFNTNVAAHEATSAVNDFSDTGLLLGFRQKLYNRFRGQLVIGMQFPDANSDLGQVFFHQTFLRVDDKSNILKMGRSRVRSALIEFPTLRDDDALYFTDVLNPFSSGENTEDNQYGNVLELAHIFGQRTWLRVHGEHFTETPVLPATTETDFSLNAVGFSLQYRVPETQIWNRPFLQQIGIGFNNFLTDRPGYTSRTDKMLKNISVSTILNLRPDPVHFWDFRVQGIYNAGFKEIENAAAFGEFARAKATAGFASLRYLYRELERPTLQLALSFGYKTFPDLLNSTDQAQVVANSFYRLGENFDAGLQVQYSRNNGDLAGLLGESETRFQFALVYAVDQSWNRQFSDRNSLLNLEHG
ncbi:MAG: hypothetical protein GWP06_01915, partial [Actinobacteria bacterium]|nr:hypothetical protein [Actinomycetota bacterium]